MNSILLKEYIRQAILESDSTEIESDSAEIIKSVNENIKNLMIFLGFKIKDMEKIAGKIDALLKDYNIIHHQFQSSGYRGPKPPLSGTPEQQHSVSLELTNIYAQTHHWSNATNLLNMIFHAICYNFSDEIRQEARKKGYKPDNLIRDVHKDPLGISLFVVPKEVDGLRITHREIEAWHILNCLGNHELFNKLKVYTFKSPEINDRNPKKLNDYFYQSDKFDASIIEDIKTFVRNLRQGRV